MRLFNGFAMGLADLVPGVSGGTMALLLGFYKELVESIADISNGRLLKSLRFLTPLVIGMCFAFLLLSPFIHFLLESPFYSPFVYLIFSIVLLAATAKLYVESERCHAGFLFFGAAAALSTLLFSPASIPAESIPNPLFALAGFIAVMAMLLPGISGSTLLLIVGMYRPILHYLSRFSRGIDFGESIPPLLYFIAGALAGALIGARGIRILLEKFPMRTYSLLIGLMGGGAIGLLVPVLRKASEML